MEKREKEVAVAFLIVALLLGMAVYTYSTNSQRFVREPPKPLDRTIVFPRDEGAHDEPEEVWAIFMNISAQNKNFYIWISWSTSQMRDPTNSTVILSMLEKNKSSKYMHSTYLSDDFLYSNTSLRLDFSKNENYFNFTSCGAGRYRVDAFSHLDKKNFKLNINLDLIKKPVLFTQNNYDLSFGELYFGNGTLFGYFLPRLAIDGTMDFKNESDIVEGSAGFIHYWGGGSVEIFESIFAQIADKDVFSLTYYNPGGDEIALEQVYVIYNNTYSIYSTYKGKTVGAVICNNSIKKDLYHEKYTFSPLSYLPDPTDATHSRVYARNWTLSTTYNDIDLKIAPILRDQFAATVLWLGAVDVKSGDGHSGWGFSVLSKRYISNPNINNLDIKKNILDNNDYLTFNITTSDPIPLIGVIVKYNYSGENFTAEATRIQGNLWSVTMGSFDKNSTIEYQIDVIDAAGNMVTKKGSYSI